MKLFLHRLMAFSFVVGLWLIAVITLNCYFIRTTPLPLEHTSVLIVGDSHIKYGIDPSVFADARNISASGEPPWVIFWKLRGVIGLLQPDTVILGLSPHNLSTLADDKFKVESWAERMVANNYPFLDPYELWSRFNLPASVLIKTYWKAYGFYPHRNHFSYIGKYGGSNRSYNDNGATTAERHYYNEGHERKGSILAVNYIDSLIQLCQSYHAVPVLVGTPLQLNYSHNIPVASSNNYQLQVAHFRREGAIVLNQWENSYGDSYFFDGNHLNGVGARRLTTDLVQALDSIAIATTTIL